MKTLVERIEEVRGFATELNKIDAERQRFLQIRTRAAQLRQSAEHLTALANSLSLMREHHIAAPIPRLTRDLKTKPAAMLQTFRQEPTSFLDDQQFAVTFKAPLEAYTAKLSESLAVAWQTHATSIVPSINEGTLSTLESAGLQKPVARLREVLSKMREIQRRLPSDKDSVIALAALGKQAREVWTEIEQVPPAVLAFLRKASRREATFSDLNDVVEKWLADKGMLGHLRISLGP